MRCAATLLVLLVRQEQVYGITKRWRGTKGVYPKNTNWLEPMSSNIYLEDCQLRCLDYPNCVSYAYDFELMTCIVASPGYETMYGSIHGVMYTETTTKQPASSPVISVAGAPVAECPVAYKTWSKELSNSKWGFVGASYSVGKTSIPVSAAFDGNTNTAARSDNATYPYIWVNFGRPFRLTNAWIVAGNTTPLYNLDVRIGNTNPSTAGNTRITFNTRCNYFSGRTNTSSQVVPITCSTPKGLKGTFLSLQMSDPFGTVLEVAEVIFEGFARICKVTTAI